MAHTLSLVPMHGFLTAVAILIAEHGLSGARALGCTGSAVMAHGLNCPVARGMLVPRPEIEPMSPALNRGTLNHLDHQGSPYPHLSGQKPLGRADIKI